MDNRKLNYFYEKKKRTDSICYGDIDFIWLMGIRQCAPGQRQSIFFLLFFFTMKSEGNWMVWSKVCFHGCSIWQKKSENVVWNTHAPKASMYKICISYVLGIHFFFYLLFSLPHYLPFIFDSFTCLWFFFFGYIPTNFKGFNVSTIWRTAW